MRKIIAKCNKYETMTSRKSDKQPQGFYILLY